MAFCVVALGSNLGDRHAYLEFAKEELAKFVSIICASRVFETKPVGYEAQGDFLNAAILLETQLKPLELLDKLQGIEILAKRERSFKNAPRTLDLDIIFYEGLRLDSERLKLPHPFWQDRAFVVEPLLDLVEQCPEILKNFGLERISLCEILEAIR